MNFKELLKQLVGSQEKEVGRKLTKDEEVRIRTNLPTRGKWNTTRAKSIMHFGKAGFTSLKTSSGKVLVHTLGPLCSPMGKTRKAQKRKEAEAKKAYTKKQWREALIHARREARA